MENGKRRATKEREKESKRERKRVRKEMKEIRLKWETERETEGKVERKQERRIEVRKRNNSARLEWLWRAYVIISEIERGEKKRGKEVGLERGKYK